MKLVFFVLIFSLSLFSSAQMVTSSVEVEQDHLKKWTESASPFLRAYYHLVGGDGETVKRLVVNGNVDVNLSKDPFGDQSLLHVAVKFGIYDMVEFLLEYGADVNAEDSQSRTALHYAVSATNAYRDVDIVELLLEYGAEVDTRDNEGRTPLNRLASVVYDIMRDEHIARLLLEHGAEVNRRDNQGSTPLHRAASVKRRRGEGIAKLLIEKGADINVRAIDWQGKDHGTPLGAAIKSFNRPMINLLLRYGTHPDIPVIQGIRSFPGITPLDFAFYLRDITVASWLLSHRAQVSSPDFLFTRRDQLFIPGFEERWDFSNEFIKDYKKKILEPLLKEGPELHARLLKVIGQNQLAKSPSVDPIDFLFTSDVLGIDTEGLLHQAARRGDLEVIAALERDGADVNEIDLAGETPLFEALRVRNLSVAELLVRLEGDVHHWNYLGDTLLHQVLRRGTKGDLVIAKWLLEQGLDINAQNLFGDTALHEAAFDERLQVLNFLLQNGASKRIQNHLGLTPAEIASFKALNEGGRVVSMLEGGDDIHCGY